MASQPAPLTGGKLALVVQEEAAEEMVDRVLARHGVVS